MQKKGFKRKLKQTLAFSLVAAMLISLMPSDFGVFADQASPTDAIENTDETDDTSGVVTQAAEDEVEQQTTTAVSEETTEEVTEDTTEAATEAVTEETAEEAEETEESAPVEVIPTFDTFYDGVSVEGLDFSSCELLIATDDTGIFTQDTEVVSEYNGIYLTRYPDATQTMNAYSYYYTRAALVEVNTSIKASDEENVVEAAENSEDEDTSDDGEDDQQTYESIDEIPNEGHGEADLSNLNNGNDAFSVVDDMTTGNYTGYIALIDTGASGSVVKKSVSVLGDDGADYNGHGSKMAEAIASANPDSKVLSIKALDNNAIGTVADVYTAIEYAIDANVSVINLSMSSIQTADSELLREAVNHALNSGIIVIAAAGNNNSNAAYYTPANISGVYTIGACDENGVKRESSNYGDVVNYYVTATSTSLASAKFAGYAVKSLDFAVMQSDVFSELKDAPEVEEVTEDTAEEDTEEDTEEVTKTDAEEIQVDEDKNLVTLPTITDEDGNKLPSSEEIGMNIPSANDIATDILLKGAYSWTDADYGYIDGLYAPYTYTHGALLSGYPTGFTSTVTITQTSGATGATSGYAGEIVGLASPPSGYEIWLGNASSGPMVACHSHLRGIALPAPGGVGDTYVISNAYWEYVGADGDWELYYTSSTVDGQSSSSYQTLLAVIAIKKNPTPEPHYVGAKKIDAETGAPVPGIQIGIYTSQSMATTPVGVITTNAEGNASVNLGTTTDEQKTYYLYEVGYTSDCPAKYRNTTNFGAGMAGKYLGSVQSKSTLTYTSYTQTSTHTGVAINAKVDAQTNTPIAGAQFTLYADANCTTPLNKTITTDANGQGGVELPYGTTTAYAKETYVPYPYVLDSNPFKLTVVSFDKPYSYANVIAAGGGVRIINEHNIYVELTKESANTACTDGNENYDVRDAQYTFYPTDTDANNNTNAIGTLTVSGTNPTVATGILDVTNSMDKNNGKMVSTPFTYKETTNAADGYLIDTSLHHITVDPSQVDSNGTYKNATVARTNVKETPTMDPITLTITKQGADGNDPTGANTLAGAQFTVWFYDKKVTNTFDNSWTPTRSWVLETKQINVDANGNPIYGINFNKIAEHKVSGDDWYYNTTVTPAEISFPEGFLKIQETAAPAGYTMTGAFTATDMNGNDINAVAGDNYIVLKANDDGIVSTENILVKDDSFNKDDKPIRADIELTKVDEDDNAMEGVTFKIERTDVTPHEIHYVMTDENGYTSTKASYTTSHSNNTNPAFPGEAKAGIWFGDTNNIDDTYGALPYGEYTITEMRSLANAGKQLETSRTITKAEIEANDGGVITVFDPDATDPDDKNWNMAKPTLKTKAKVLETSDNTTDSQTLAQAGSSNVVWTDQTIEDTITFTKLRADSTEYTFLTELMIVDKDGNAEIYTKNGQEYRQITPYTSPAAYDKSIYEVDGEIVVNIEHVDPTGLEEQQKKLVVYESLYYGHYDTLEELDEAIANGTVATRYPVYSDEDDMDFFPVEHKDNDDDYQTVRPGDIHTTAEDSVSLDHIADNSVTAKLNDEVFFTGLTPGVTYTISGKLVVKEGTDWTNIKYDPTDPNADADGFVTTTTTSGDGKAYFLKDKDGNDVVASTTVTPTSPEGSATITFEFDASDLEGKTLVAFEALSYNGIEIAVHTDINDEDEAVHYPLIHTTTRNSKADITKATDADEEAIAKQVAATDGESFIDEILYQNLLANRSYVAKAVLMDKATGEVMKDASGKEITAEITFKTDDVGAVVIDKTPDAVDYVLADGTKLDLSSDHADYLCSDTVEVEFTGYDFSNLAGKTGVVYEEIYLQKTTGSTTDLILVGEHKDITDIDQFIYYVEVGTKAEDTTTQSKVVPYNKDTVLEDVVSFTNVIPEKKYTLTAELVVKNDKSGKYKDGDKLLDASGKPIVVTHEFIPKTANGEETVQIKVNTAPYKDMEIVVFESLKNMYGLEIATHNDLSDEDQTLEVPGGETTANDKATGDHVSSASKTVTIVDTIVYRNLQADGKHEYTATGTLYKKSTKEPLKDANGKVITNTVKFTPEAGKKNGEVQVEFTIDASLLAGESIVVFEDVLYKDETVFIHHDIEDKAQTVDIPKIGTTATIDNGKKSATASKKTTIVDKVEYKNLVADGTKEYTVTGYLYDKSTGEKLVINGQYVMASKTFKPEKSDGFIELSFTFDASSLSTDIVVFEYLYHNGVEVATHTEIEDEGQTVTITPPTAPPKTGMIIFISVLGLLAIGGAGMLIFRKRAIK